MDSSSHGPGELIFFREGTTVWLSHLREGWVPAVVVSVQSTSEIVVAPDREASIKYGMKSPSSSLRPTSSRDHVVVDLEQKDAHPKVLPRQARVKADDFGAVGEERLDALAHLHEAAVLNNIRVRFKQNQIYSSTGLMLIAMNPYKELDLYGTATVNLYRGDRVHSPHLPPHLFGVAGRAYERFKTQGQDQSLIICGESGAGKTESTKLILRFLSTIASKAGVGDIENQILESNPLMEAFGNAKTIRNQNSSRFGKFIQITLGSQDWILGANIKNYLLEKSRVSAQPSGERNYHIFYQMLAGMDNDALDSMHLQRDGSKYHYLNQSGCLNVGGLNDSLEFQRTLTAMIALNLGTAVRKEIFSIVAAVLHLGNIEFTTGGGDDSGWDDEEEEESRMRAKSLDPHGEAEIGNHEVLRLAAKLLGVDEARLGRGLTLKIRTTLGSTIATPLRVKEAEQVRDALAKELYDKMFTWLVSRINSTIGTAEGVKGFIGILDIYGFENLGTNGFEQLLINYANEKLQKLFNDRVFLMEEEEYLREGVPYVKPTFVDGEAKSNTPGSSDCLTLIEDYKYGILSLVNEQSMLGVAGSDEALAAKINYAYSSNGSFPRKSFMTVSAWHKLKTSKSTGGAQNAFRGGSQTNFVVKHYAGEILYSTHGCVLKNKDTLSSIIRGIFSSSDSTVVREMHALSHGQSLEKAPSSGRSRHRKVSSLQTTVTKRFRTQLNTLVANIGETEPHFIRCIRSNGEAVPDFIDSIAVLRQLKYSGVMEALRVRRLGFSNRMPYRSFLLRYETLTNDAMFLQNVRDNVVSIGELKEAAAGIFENDMCRQHNLGAESFKLGHTLIFLRAYVMGVLDAITASLLSYHATVIQRTVRKLLERRKFARMKMAAEMLQRHIRGLQARQLHEAMVMEINRKAQALKAEMEARRLREEEESLVAGAKNTIQHAQLKLEKLRESTDVEGKHLIAVDKDSRGHLENVAKSIEKALEQFDNGGEAFSNGAEHALQKVEECAVFFESVKTRREEEYHFRIQILEKERAARKKREEMNEAAERSRMKREEDLRRLYLDQLKQLERTRENSERFAMKRQEEQQRWVISELLRLERQREAEELKVMIRLEGAQREMAKRIERYRLQELERRKREESQREFVERHRMEAEEAYQIWLKKEIQRLQDAAITEQNERDRAIASAELASMIKEEKSQLQFHHYMREEFQRSLMLFQRIEEERRLEELQNMTEVETKQKRVEKILRQQEVDLRVRAHEKLLMQSEDMASRMFCLSESIGSRMTKIRHYERTLGGFTTPTATPEDSDPFALIRSMTNDLSRHTSKINDASKERTSPSPRAKRKEHHGGEAEKVQRIENAEERMVEETAMESEDRRSLEMSQELEFQILASNSVPHRVSESPKEKIVQDRPDRAGENVNAAESNSHPSDAMPDSLRTEEKPVNNQDISRFTNVPAPSTAAQNDFRLSKFREEYTRVRQEAEKYLGMLASPIRGGASLGQSSRVEELSFEDLSVLGKGYGNASTGRGGHSESKFSQDIGVLEQATNLMAVRRRGMSMFGPDMLLSASRAAPESSMSDSSPALFAGKSFAVSNSGASLWETSDDDSAAFRDSSLSEIDSFISQHIPEHVRTPQKSSKSSLLTSSSTPAAGGKSSGRSKSWWKEEANFISEDTDELELLRIRRNVSHLRMHGNYPTSMAEEHFSRTIPPFLIGHDVQKQQEEYDTLDMLERDDQGMMEASYKFLERTNKRV